MIFSTLNNWGKHRGYVHETCDISPLVQLFQIILWRMRGFNSQEYYMYPLYDYDPRPVLSIREYDQLQAKLNPLSKGVIPVDKWIQSAIWKSQNIAHAKVMGFVRCGQGVLEQQAYEGELGLLRDFILKQEFPFVIKPIDGANGVGFDLVLDYQRTTDSLLLSQGGTLSLQRFQELYANTPEGVIFQEKITQHPVLNTVFSKSVNTLRVITHRSGQGHHKVLQTMVKFGGGGNIIDNDVFKGVLAEMDIETGALGIGQRRFGSEKFDQHPDTGAQIKGVTVPFWRDALELAISAHRLLPYPSHLGWDIAISEEGPLVVEMNSYLSIAVNQKLHGKKIDQLEF